MKGALGLLSRDVLWNEYVEQNKSCEAIGKIYGFCGGTIRNWLIKNGISIRTTYNQKPVPPRDELERTFISENRSIAKTADHYPCCAQTVGKWLRDYGIETDPQKTKLSMIGFSVGSLVVVAEAVVQQANQATWVVECSNCETTLEIPGWKLRTQRVNGCVECDGNAIYQGVGELSGAYWAKVIGGARDRNIEFTITKDYAWTLFIRQQGRCALTGQELSLCRHYKRRVEQTASLDRIDSTQGYCEGNVQWVHKRINRMKGPLSDSEFVSWCSQVVAHKGLDS